MIQNLCELYTLLDSSPKQIDEIVTNINNYYSPKQQPKTKYGDFQRDKQGVIKYRDLLVPKPALKILQQRLVDIVGGIAVPEYAFGSVYGTNHILNASKHLNQTYFLTIDLKNFFQNINNDQVFSALMRNGFSPSVSRIITKLTTYKRSLPQGAPSSPILANLVFENTADKLCKLIAPLNITFTTFLDDLSFSSKKCFQLLIFEILEIIRKDQFFPANDKIHYRKGQSEITGLTVSGDRLKVKPEMLEKAKIKPLVKAYVTYVNRYNTFCKTNGYPSKVLIRKNPLPEATITDEHDCREIFDEVF